MIEAQTTTVFYSSNKGRRYLTLRAACMAEAKAALREKYGEPFETDTGAGLDPVYEEAYQPLLNRYFRMILNIYKANDKVKG